MPLPLAVAEADGDNVGDGVAEEDADALEEGDVDTEPVLLTVCEGEAVGDTVLEGEGVGVAVGEADGVELDELLLVTDDDGD